MSEHPGWRRADLLLAIAIAVVIAVALVAPRWRTGAAGAIGSAGSRELIAEGDPSALPKLPPARLERHRSPFDDAVTARAETLCVKMVQSEVGFALKEPVDVNVTDRYGMGNEDDGRGVYLDFDGLARTASGRISAWRCEMKSYGAYPGGPTITHVEKP